MNVNALRIVVTMRKTKEKRLMIGAATAREEEASLKSRIPGRRNYTRRAPELMIPFPITHDKSRWRIDEKMKNVRQTRREQEMKILLVLPAPPPTIKSSNSEQRRDQLK
jgi:riboflavin biosynthesis pyrimidine reductase